MLQRRHLIAQTVVGKGADVIPAAIPVRRVFQRIQRLLIPPGAYISVGGRLILVALRLLGISTLTAVKATEGVVAVATVALIGLGLLRVFDLLLRY